MEAHKYRLLSLDLWDTVIRRKCYPDEIKEETSKYILNNYWQHISKPYRSQKNLTQLRIAKEREIGAATRAQGGDDEYELHDVLKGCLDIAMPQFQDKQKLVNELYDFELQTEIANAYLDPTIEETVANENYAQLAYISDFYADTGFIDEILEAIGCRLKFDYRFISCECGFNKRSGKLFEYVLSQCKIAPHMQMHIGDNQYSDVEVPSGIGIETKEYRPATEEQLRQEKEKAYRNYRDESGRISKCSGLKEKSRISVFFYGFISWILESCIQDRIQNIYFFTREGEFFKKTYDEICRNFSDSGTIPKAQIMEVSRLSTFCPSIREFTLDEMMRLWNQYSIQSMAAFLKSLGIENKRIEALIWKREIELNEEIMYPWLDRRVQELFVDEEFIALLEGERDQKKELIAQYMSQLGFSKEENKEIAIVDIGWRGTIQDNLCYLYPNYKIKGFYIGLIPFLNAQPYNSEKRGYLNGYQNFNMLLKYVMPFEMICNSPNGSAISYVRGKDNRVIAIRKKEMTEDAVYFTFTESMQEKVLEDMQILFHKFPNVVHASASTRQSAYESLNRFILYPRHDVAKAYFSLKHNEEFGVGEYVDKSTRFRLDLFVKALVSRKGIKELACFLAETTWPQGYLTLYHMRPLIWIYNMIKRKREKEYHG